jgi:Kelch motif
MNTMRWSELSESSPPSSGNGNVEHPYLLLGPASSSSALTAHPPTIKNHSVTYFNGKFFVYGGYDGRRNHATLLIYDIKEERWFRPAPVSSSTAAAAGFSSFSTASDHRMCAAGDEARFPLLDQRATRNQVQGRFLNDIPTATMGLDRPSPSRPDNASGSGTGTRFSFDSNGGDNVVNFDAFKGDEHRDREGKHAVATGRTLSSPMPMVLDNDENERQSNDDDSHDALTVATDNSRRKNGSITSPAVAMYPIETDNVETVDSMAGPGQPSAASRPSLTADGNKDSDADSTSDCSNHSSTSSTSGGSTRSSRRRMVVEEGEGPLRPARPFFRRGEDGRGGSTDHLFGPLPYRPHSLDGDDNVFNGISRSGISGYAGAGGESSRFLGNPNRGASMSNNQSTSTLFGGGYFVRGSPPPGRNGHSATLAVDPDDEENGRIIIIGGWLGTGPLAANDTHCLDITGPGGRYLQWYQPPVRGTPPGPCNMHSADYVPAKREVYVFRGGNGREYLNDLHALHVQSLVWRRVGTFLVCLKGGVGYCSESDCLFLV